MDKEIVMYSRTTGCPYMTLAKHVLDEEGLAYREIFIDQDMEARTRVLNWTGFLSVPTIVAANPGQDLPHTEPNPLPRGYSPRGIHRGAMITEPSAAELKKWLGDQGFIQPENIFRESSSSV